MKMNLMKRISIILLACIVLTYPIMVNATASIPSSVKMTDSEEEAADNKMEDGSTSPVQSNSNQDIEQKLLDSEYPQVISHSPLAGYQNEYTIEVVENEPSETAADNSKASFHVKVTNPGTVSGEANLYVQISEEALGIITNPTITDVDGENQVVLDESHISLDGQTLENVLISGENQEVLEFDYEWDKPEVTETKSIKLYMEAVLDTGESEENIYGFNQTTFLVEPEDKLPSEDQEPEEKTLVNTEGLVILNKTAEKVEEEENKFKVTLDIKTNNIILPQTEEDIAVINDGVVTEVLSDYVELADMDGEENIPEAAIVSTDEESGKLTLNWKLSDMEKNSSTSFSYYVSLKEDYVDGTEYEVNESSSLEFTDVNEESEVMAFDNPLVRSGLNYTLEIATCIVDEAEDPVDPGSPIQLQFLEEDEASVATNLFIEGSAEYDGINGISTTPQWTGSLGVKENGPDKVYLSRHLPMNIKAVSYSVFYKKGTDNYTLKKTDNITSPGEFSCGLTKGEVQDGYTAIKVVIKYQYTDNGYFSDQKSIQNDIGEEGEIVLNKYQVDVNAKSNVGETTVIADMDLVLLLDVSDTMYNNPLDTENTKYKRITAMKDNVRAFITQAKAIATPTSKLGVVIYGYGTKVIRPLSTFKTMSDAELKTLMDSVNRTQLNYGATGGGYQTRTDLAMLDAYNLLKTTKNTGRSQHVVLFTDGEPGKSTLKELFEEKIASKDLAFYQRDIYMNPYRLMAETMNIAEAIKESGPVSPNKSIMGSTIMEPTSDVVKYYGVALYSNSDTWPQTSSWDTRAYFLPPSSSDYSAIRDWIQDNDSTEYNKYFNKPEAGNLPGKRKAEGLDASIHTIGFFNKNYKWHKQIETFLEGVSTEGSVYLPGNAEDLTSNIEEIITSVQEPPTAYVKVTWNENSSFKMDGITVPPSVDSGPGYVLWGPYKMDKDWEQNFHIDLTSSSPSATLSKDSFTVKIYRNDLYETELTPTEISRDVIVTKKTTP